MPTQIQLKTVKTVEIEPESAVRRAGVEPFSAAVDRELVRPDLAELPRAHLVDASPSPSTPGNARRQRRRMKVSTHGGEGGEGGCPHRQQPLPGSGEGTRGNARWHSSQSCGGRQRRGGGMVPATHMRALQVVLDAVPDPGLLVHPRHRVLIIRLRAHPRRIPSIATPLEVPPRGEILPVRVRRCLEAAAAAVAAQGA